MSKYGPTHSMTVTVAGAYTHLAPPLNAKELNCDVGTTIRSIVRKTALSDGLR